jgi:type II secretory pathway component GspD/PulD (secretin)
VLRILQESGAGKTVGRQRIVTVNNREGSILDGDRLAYVARFGSYRDLYETDEIRSGLFLSVTPSLGQSGYLKMSVVAKMTHLSTFGSSGASLPGESGQIVENTVTVQDGQSFLLGGLKRTMTVTSKRRFPVLGYVLPFLFSRETKTEQTRDLIIQLTPQVIELGASPVPEGLAPPAASPRR